MGLLGDVASLIATAWRVFRDSRDAQRVRPQELFDTYVAPSYSMLKTIHADYLEMYHELSARIHLENELSDETVRWFSLARTKHQADRSELRILDMPGLRDSATYGGQVNRAISAYLWEVRNCIEPQEADAWRASSRYPWFSSSASTRTEARLLFLSHWMHLSPEDRRVLLTEDYFRPFRPIPDMAMRGRLLRALELHAHEQLQALDLSTRAHMINDLLSAATGEVPIVVDEEIAIVSAEAQRAYPDGNVLPAAPPGTEWGTDESLRWRAVLQEHIDEELANIQQHLAVVQQAFMRLRILTDRTSGAATA